MFLSFAFLRRIRMQWKPGLKGFLIGERNLFFFYPDFFLESADITPASIESFLSSHGKESSQLLGILTPEQVSFLPGFAELTTHDERDPQQWEARIHLLTEQGDEYRQLQLQIGDSNAG